MLKRLLQGVCLILGTWTIGGVSSSGSKLAQDFFIPKFERMLKIFQDYPVMEFISALDPAYKNVLAIAQDFSTRDMRLCSCEGNTCGCCYTFVATAISVNHKVCLTTTSLADGYGFQTQITVNSKVIFSADCSCQGYTCGCCVAVAVSMISLNIRACANISYLPDEYGMQYRFTFNDKMIRNIKYTVKNPPPICGSYQISDKIPIKMIPNLCLKLYDLDYKNHEISGCTAVYLDMGWWGQAFNFDLGCLNFKTYLGELHLRKYSRDQSAVVKY